MSECLLRQGVPSRSFGGDISAGFTTRSGAEYPNILVMCGRVGFTNPFFVSEPAKHPPKSSTNTLIPVLALSQMRRWMIRTRTAKAPKPTENTSGESRGYARSTRAKIMKLSSGYSSGKSWLTATFCDFRENRNGLHLQSSKWPLSVWELQAMRSRSGQTILPAAGRSPDSAHMNQPSRRRLGKKPCFQKTSARLSSL